MLPLPTQIRREMTGLFQLEARGTLPYVCRTFRTAVTAFVSTDENQLEDGGAGDDDALRWAAPKGANAKVLMPVSQRVPGIQNTATRTPLQLFQAKGNAVQRLNGGNKSDRMAEPLLGTDDDDTVIMRAPVRSASVGSRKNSMSQGKQCIFFKRKPS